MPAPTSQEIQPTIVTSLTLGLLGGGALIATFRAGPFFVEALHLPNKGFWIFVPYGALLIATASYLYFRRVESFARRLAIGFEVYLTSTLIISIYLMTVENPKALTRPWTFFLWLAAVQIAIGIVSGTVVATLSRNRQRYQPADGS
jgi:hypothetical protein